MSTRVTTINMKTLARATVCRGAVWMVRHDARYTSTISQTPKTAAVAMNDKIVLSRLPLKILLRSFIMTTLMSSQWLIRPSIAVLGAIHGTKSVLLNADKNRLLNSLLRWTVYDHFCAGTNHEEVRRSVAEFKKLGYQGIILAHAKEILLDPKDMARVKGTGEYSPACYDMVEQWKQCSIDTLRMLQPGDFLALKLTGAGPIAVNALQATAPIPEAVDRALMEICEEAKKQGAMLWFDAEQQALQPTVDAWVIEYMRRWNRDISLVYNTIQAYLKDSAANLDRHITLAAQEGWSLGIKLVRGAYIEHEIRTLIHDNKSDTDRSYDSLADKLISQNMPIELQTQSPGLQFPRAALMLATHNAESTMKACARHKARLVAGQPTCSLECAQVAGMADELSCQLIQNYEQCAAELSEGAAPKAFKYLNWGSVSECMGYLHRRAVENRGGVERTKHMANALGEELWRRFSARSWIGDWNILRFYRK
ncbi:Putative proline oxidase [Tolypocladium paradoxum]|uniref:Proline dehydrogenase n=1 Tax=Tolypocladium paradoxum TaxID=94208 RepID=A0A2S4KS43_9HYPO|nr:Putative proline oxidase [Tolypocladium paradoxum]